MKFLTQYIFEKLKLGKSTKVSITDYINNHDIHKIKFNEFYKYIEDNSAKIELYITDVKNNSTLIPVELDINGHHNILYGDSENDFIIYCQPSSTNQLSTADIKDLYDNNTKKFNSVCFYTMSGVYVHTRYIPFAIIEDGSVLQIYICTDRDFNSIAAKRKLSDVTIQQEPGLFDKWNEQKLKSKFDKQTQQMIDSIPDKYKYRNKKGEANLFWKVYSTLLLHGPMSKVEVLETINKILGTDLITTSYSTAFTQWSKYNLIIPVKRKLEPQPYSDWKN